MNNTRRWYVLHPVRQSAANASSALAEHGIETYVAALLPNTLFAHLTQHEFDTLFRRNSDDTSQQTSVTYHYDMSYRNVEGKCDPLTIPDSLMRSFIIATQTHEEQITVLPADWQPKGYEQAVRVVRGQYKGLCGMMTVDKGGYKHIVISLKGLVTLRMPRIRDTYIDRIANVE